MTNMAEGRFSEPVRGWPGAERRRKERADARDRRRAAATDALNALPALDRLTDLDELRDVARTAGAINDELRELDDDERAREGVDPVAAPRERDGDVVTYRFDELDERDRTIVRGLAARLDLDPEHVASTFAVGRIRSRRSYVVLFTAYRLDEHGDRVVVLGDYCTSQHMLPVGPDELPAACRRAGR